jgi:hypothetical protein
MNLIMQLRFTDESRRVQQNGACDSMKKTSAAHHGALRQTILYYCSIQSPDSALKKTARVKPPRHRVTKIGTGVVCERGGRGAHGAFGEAPGCEIFDLRESSRCSQLCGYAGELLEGGDQARLAQ